MKRVNVLVAGVTAAFALNCGGSAAPPPSAPGEATPPATAAASGLESITAHDLRAHVELLASDQYAGRETLQQGARLAAAHLASEFARYGLEPMPGASSFEVPYTLHALGYEAAGTYAKLRIGDRELPLEAGEDFTPFPFSTAGEARAPIVFAGYGVTAPELDYDDYEGLDVTGKYVLVFRYTPRPADGEADPFEGTQHALFATKARNAAEHGAIGMILVTGPLHRDGGDDLRLSRMLGTEPVDAERLERLRQLRQMQRRGETSTEPDRFLAVQVSQLAASKLIASIGRPLKDVQGAIDTGAKPAELALTDTEATIAVAPQAKSEPVTAYNVAAFLRGSDPALADEWIVIGAHYDHLGGYAGGASDGIYNGADDNASGTAGMLELAQAFAAAPERPKRSLLFVGFSGEEKGLLGSRAMIEQEILPVDRVVFMLNLDMIGRNPEEPVDVVGDGYGTGIKEIVEQANATVQLPVTFGGADYSGASDHHPFYQRDVPFLFFFTGLHEDYHQLSDHADKLAYARMQDVVRVAYGTVDGVARAAIPPRFVHHVTWLGATVRVEGEGEAARAVLSEIVDNSRGADAGLRAGDVVTGLGGEPVADAESVGGAFNAVEPGTTVSIQVERGGAAQTIDVERAKPGYLGVFPSGVSDEQKAELALGDDEGVLIRGLSSDGPAGKAGIREGDILIRIGGLPVDIRSLGMHLARFGAGETVPIVVVRDGARVDLSLTLGERPQRP